MANEQMNPYELLGLAAQGPDISEADIRKASSGARSLCSVREEVSANTDTGVHPGIPQASSHMAPG